LENSAFVPIGEVRKLAAPPGALASLTYIPGEAALAPHRHDDPYLSLHLLGSYEEETENGSALIDRPSLAFHPAGSAHCDVIGTAGLRTVIIRFDRSLLARSMSRRGMPERSIYWRGGPIADLSRSLARRWVQRPNVLLVGTTLSLLATALQTDLSDSEPLWLLELDRRIAELGPCVSIADLARAVGLSPAWIARRHRQLRGEGLAERLSRLRLEAAHRMVAAHHAPLADIAAQTGFYDQSHLNKAFRETIGITPGVLRQQSFRALVSNSHEKEKRRRSRAGPCS
jgi:AraC-like DNA-binding protein